MADGLTGLTWDIAGQPCTIHTADATLAGDVAVFWSYANSSGESRFPATAAAADVQAALTAALTPPQISVVNESGQIIGLDGTVTGTING